MHDLKLRNLFPIANWEQESQLQFKSPACSVSALSYRDSLHLAHALAMVPGYSFMNGEIWGTALVRAMKEMDSLNPDEPRVTDRAIAIFDEHDTLPQDSSTIQHFYESTESAGNIASLPGRHLSHGALHSLLYALVVQSWSAFEVLSEQLMSGVLAERPDLDMRTKWTSKKRTNTSF